MTGGEGHTYGEKWDYINDWVCLGGYSGYIEDNATGWTESDIYLYPAVDTTHGNVFNYGGKIPGRVQTGDCNSANKLNWKGNAASYGNCDNCYSFGFAWMYSPSGAGPKFLIGADDDQRTYVNGTMISSGTSCCNRDNFETGGISMPSGWSRILFKVRNGGGGFDGTVSLRNGGDRGWNEGSVTRYSSSYGLGYEQDDWYPRIDVSSFYGGSNPQPNGDYYGNSTTVTASGTASVTGPVPFWKVMYFDWGYGISERNYTDVGSSGTSWSHTQTGVTGHRRFHFFSVSKSKRCSFQNSGVSGGWNFADGGPANYMDVYVDNVAPQNPSFSSVTAAGTDQINLAWAIPLDQGVGISAGSDEAADEASSTSSNYYRRGDVGVQVYRGGSAIYTWNTGTSKGDTGLTPNTAYTYTIEARDNTGSGRGSWYNYTGQQGSTSKYTLIETPATLTFGTITVNSIVLNTSGCSNPSSGNSGVYFDSTTTGGDGGINEWVQATTDTATGLAANTQYTFQAKARNGDSAETGYSGTASAWTLSVPPAAGSVTPDLASPCAGNNVTWTAVGGFGGGKIAKYKYVWDQSATHTWTESEADWSTGTIQTTPTTTGNWYLHVKGYNGANVANGTYDYLLAALPVAETPTDGTPSSTATTSVMWNWSDVSSETGYRVKDTGGSNKSGDLGANTTQWTESSGISANTQYTRRIYAFNACGESTGSTGQTKYSLQEAATTPSFSNVSETGLRVTTTGPVNLTSGSSGVVFHDGTADRTKVTELYEDVTGLTANTEYTFKAKGVNGDGVTTGYSGTASTWTLSVPPTVGTVTADQSNPARVNWTAVNGFGAGKVQYYRYAFDQSPTHTWTGSEPQWSSGTVATLPTAGGTWYLHVKGYNGADVGNGTYDYAITAPTAAAVTTHPTPQTVCYGQIATFTTTASGTTPAYAWYKHANGGWGSAWSASGGGGAFLGSSAVNNSGDPTCNAFSSYADINTAGGNALGIYGGGGGEGVTRSFPTALTSGQVLRLDMDNGNVESGVDVGFTLQNSSGATLMGLKFTGGGGTYKYYDANSDHDTGIGFTRTGLRVQVLVGSGGTFALFITPCGGSTSGFMGTFANSGDPAKVLLYNNNTSGGDAKNLYFNTLIAGTAYDTADNYSSDWNGQDKGDQQISGESGTSYQTSGNNGDNFYSLAFNSAGVSVSANALLAITPKALTMSGLSVSGSKVYDGTTIASVSGTPALQSGESFPGGTCDDGKPFTGDDVSLSGTAAGTYDSKDVATASSVTYAGLGLSGAHASRYTLTIQGPASATITPKALTVVGLTANNKVYDAKTTAPLGGSAVLLAEESPGSGSTSDGKPYTGDTVNVVGTAAGTFADRHVGTGKAVTVTGSTLSGAQAGNYTPTQQTGLTADITPKALTVTGLTASAKVYDATTTAPLGGSAALLADESPGSGSTGDGKPYTGDTVNVGGTAAGAFADRHVGTGKGVTVTGSTLSGAEAGNYTATQPTGLTANITPKALSITGLSAVAKFYDGTTDVVLNGSGGLLPAEEPGGSTDDGKPYNVDTVSVEGTAAGEFADRNVGTDIAVNISGVSLTGAESGNYTAALAVTGDILDTKTDASTTTIVDANSADFGLWLNNGTLMANASESINGTGTVTVNDGAVLGGTGKVGAIAVNSGGLLAPGGSGIGTLGVGGNVTLNSGSTTAVEVNTNGLSSDRVTGIDTFTAGGKLEVANTGGALKAGNQFTLFSAGSYGGQFAAISPVNPNDEPSGEEQQLMWDRELLRTNGILRAHHIPYATNRVLYRATGVSLKIRLNTLFPSPDPLDAETVVLASHTHGSQGAGVSNNATTLFYYPVNHNNDSLEYTVSDGRGGVRGRKIDIYVTNYVQNLTITKTNGSNSVSFYAVPGYEYVIQRSPDIEKGPWSDIATQACGTSGLYQYMEEPPFSPVFYRARTP